MTGIQPSYLTEKRSFCYVYSIVPERPSCRWLVSHVLVLLGYQISYQLKYIPYHPPPPSTTHYTEKQTDRLHRSLEPWLNTISTCSVNPRELFIDMEDPLRYKKGHIYILFYKWGASGGETVVVLLLTDIYLKKEDKNILFAWLTLLSNVMSSTDQSIARHAKHRFLKEAS